MDVSMKGSIRQKFILSLMLIALAGFSVDSKFTTEQPTVIAEEVDTLSVNTLLVDTASFLVKNPKYYQYDIDKMPSEIFTFLEGYEANRKTNKEIVIFEIIDTVAKNEKIQQLISEGDILFREDKLTSPAGNNAFERYEDALLLEKDNKQALAGIQKIVDRYLSLVELVIKKNETYKVAGLVENAYRVSEDYFNIASQVKKYSAYIKDESIFIGQSDYDIDPNAALTVSEQKANESNARMYSSLVDVDKKTADIARSLVEQQDIYGAIKVLESFSMVSDHWQDSYDLLLGLYLKVAMNENAEALVYNNKTLDVFQFAEKAAHIFVAREDSVGAIQLLEGQQPDIEHYPNYYRLKAGLYFETGNYSGSSTLYRKLLHIDYTNPIYWLGLAASLDELEDGKALQAFHYANYYAAKQSDIKRYIEENVILASIY